MSAAQKLTKKQKKALAFRERKGKGKAKAVDEDNDVPVEENLDLVEAQVEDSHVEDPQGRGKPEATTLGEAKRVVEGGRPAQKRKREEEKPVEGGEQSKPKKKKRKATDSEGVATGDAATEAGEQPADMESKVKQKQRFILFVGNFKYTTTREAIQKHFAVCDPPPSIRLITPKASPSGKTTAKSKGCAFLEFGSRNALQQALKLHQSELEGRMINVELTAGGGGKSESRLEKLKRRNKELHEQREKQLKKQKKGPQNGSEEVHAPRPQRYSATSGVDQTPSKKHTWTVGDTVDEETKRSKKSKKRPPKALGTGVNAIPVG